MPTAQGFNTTTEQRAAWDFYRCRSDRMTRAAFPSTIGTGPDGWIQLLVATEGLAAWQWFATCMERHGVTFDETAGGTYNCRIITGGSGYSLHSYGIALDLNPSRNPYGSTLVTDFPQGFIDEVLALRTVNGRRVFRWGGDWDDDPDTGHNAYDAMHWELTCSPQDLATGLALEDDMALTADEEAFVRGIIRAVKGGARWVNGVYTDGVAAPSDPSAFGAMVDMVRNPPTAGAVDADLRAKFNAHQHAEGVTAPPREGDKI